MLEINNLKKPSSSGTNNGVDIQGWDSITLTKTAGCTPRSVDGKVVYDFSINTVNWLRIPYANTPYPLGDDCEIIVRFIIREIKPGQRVILWSRYKQGFDSPSSMIRVNADGGIVYGANNASYTTTGVVSFNVEHEIKVVRVNNTYNVYLDEVQIFQLVRVGVYLANWDWVFGSYLSAQDAVITATYAFPVDWSLLGVTVKRI